LAHLTTLDLGENFIGDRGARALAASPHLARLTTLDLSVNDIRDAGAEALANSPYLTRLTSLYLDSNKISWDVGWRALLRRFGKAVYG
jgi:Leucine-rich repeat (LRR) protein